MVSLQTLPHPRRRFRPLDHYLPSDNSYRILPLRFMRWDEGEVLLTSDSGEYAFLDEPSFLAFTGHRLAPETSVFRELKAKHFLTDTGLDVPVRLLATKLRTKKSFLAGGPRLHMFVVTLRCDHSCRYCQVSRVTADRDRFDMSRETAARALALVFRSPSRALKVELQGGESLLNFDLIRWIVEHAEERNRQEQRDLQFVIATNLVPLTDEIVEFCRSHQVFLSTSLDGPEDLHNANRPRPGRNSYALAIEGIQKARSALGEDRISAIMTTTRRSLPRAREIVDEYVRQGFASIFLRPISPYGFAVRTREAVKYETLEFLDFYRAGLEHVIELNRQGTRIAEVYAQILLTKMLTPFPTGYVDLQAPVGTSAVAYNYDGGVYAGDEARMLAEMGDTKFRLGNVHEHDYEELFGGARAERLLADSVAENLPGCTDCAFLPYCGADPIFHHRTQGDPVGHRATSAFCAKNMAIIRLLFSLLRKGDAFTRDLLTSWATQVPVDAPA